VHYFVTGATGFIGRQLIPLLLARGGDVDVLVRPGSQARFDALRRPNHPGRRLNAVTGDIGAPGLAVSDADGERRPSQGWRSRSASVNLMTSSWSKPLVESPVPPSGPSADRSRNRPPASSTMSASAA
jgi:NAD(P)-dependent dehydrogenase (short-subunit alcohol dehydrogenase family)